MVIFPSERDVLTGHVIEGRGGVPGFVRVAGIFRKVRCSGSSRSAIDWGQEHKIAPWIIDLAAAQCQAVLVFCEPEAVVQHEAEEALLGSDNSFPVDDLHGVAGATDSASMLASGVTGKRKCGLADELFGIVVVLDLDAVIGMVADAARSVKRVRAQSVLVSENRKPAIRTPQDLPPNTRPVVEATVGLPSI